MALLLLMRTRGVAAVLTVFARPFGGFLQHHVGLSPRSSTPCGPWLPARHLCCPAGVDACIYRFAPNRKPYGRWYTVGGVGATAAWLLASVALSFYISSFGNYAKPMARWPA